MVGYSRIKASMVSPRMKGCKLMYTVTSLESLAIM